LIDERARLVTRAHCPFFKKIEHAAMEMIHEMQENIRAIVQGCAVMRRSRHGRTRLLVVV
jgi:hypothetical protein